MRPPNLPRRRYLIDPLQYRIIVTSMLYVLAVVLVFAGALFMPLAMALNMEMADSPALRDAAREFLSLHNRVWPPVAALMMLLVIHNVLFSHKIVGPLFRIRSDLKRVGDGNLFVQVKLRKNDYLEKEAASINEMVDSLRTKIRGIEQNQKKATAVLADLQKALVRGTAADMADQIDDLGEILGRLRESVEQFQLPRDAARLPEGEREAASEKSPLEPAGAGISHSV